MVTDYTGDTDKRKSPTKCKTLFILTSSTWSNCSGSTLVSFALVSPIKSSPLAFFRTPAQYDKRDQS